MAAIYAQDFSKEEPSTPVTLPIRYWDGESMMAFFPLPSKRVQGLLPSPQMKPVEVVPGYAVVSFVAFEYQDTDIGPYNELGISFPILFNNPVSLPFLPLLFEKRYPRLGFYVHHLPVTTEIANRAGRDFYGYPKFVADIHFEQNDRQRTCHLHEGGKHILSLTVDKPEGKTREEERGLVTYSILGGKVLKTAIQTKMRIEHRRIRGAELSLGEHEISRELKSLGISPRIIESRYADEMEALLPAPTPC